MAQIRRSRPEWLKLIAEWRAGGRSPEQFCAKRGIRPGTFKWWVWKIDAESSPSTGTAALVPVTVSPTIRLDDRDVRGRAARRSVPLRDRNGSDLRCCRRARDRLGPRRVVMLPRATQIWFATEPVDMRCGHDGLMAIAKNRLGVDPFSGHLIVFLSKRRDRCKGGGADAVGDVAEAGAGLKGQGGWKA